MQVAISNFRCYKDPVTFTFPPNQVTLLKGASGSGKTTIFQAVVWALYGKVKKVGPWDLPQAKTNVTLSFYFLGRPMRVIRTRNPCRLVLHGWSNTVIEDKEAQEAIHQIMGTELVWQSSSYLGQKALNAFITAPNDGKTELLHALTFSEENPELFIAKVDAKFTEVKKEYDVKVDLLNQRVSKFQALYSDVDWSLTTPVADLQAASFALQQRLSNKQIEFGEYKSKSALQRALVLQIGDLGQPRSKQELLVEIERLTQMLSQMRERDRLVAEAARLKLGYREVPIYTQSDLLTAQQAEERYAKATAEFKNLNVPYGEEGKNQAVAQRQYLLSQQSQVREQSQKLEQLTHEIRVKTQQVNSITSVLTQTRHNLRLLQAVPKSSYVPTELTEPVVENVDLDISSIRQQVIALSQHLAVLRQGLDVLTCPHCLGSVRYTTGSLTTAEHKTDPAEIQREEQVINSMNEQIRILVVKQQQQQVSLSQYRTALALEQQRREQHRLAVIQEAKNAEMTSGLEAVVREHEAELEKQKTELVSLQQQLTALGPVSTIPLLSLEQSGEIQRQIVKIEGLVLESAPQISSSTILSNLQQLECNNRYLQAQAAADAVTVTGTVVEQTALLTKLQSEMATRDRLDLLTQQFSALTVPPDPSQEIATLQVQLIEANNIIAKANKREVAVSEHTVMVQENAEVKALQVDVTALHALLTLGKNKEAETLRSVVATINEAMSDICPSIFEDDIWLQLNLFSEEKTKAKVNFTASYKGGTLDSINQFSGGEADRASIAVTLALSSLSGCPFVLLDESLGGLDTGTKDKVVGILMERCANKAIILIAQDSSEGQFDSVVSI